MGCEFSLALELGEKLPLSRGSGFQKSKVNEQTTLILIHYHKRLIILAERIYLSLGSLGLHNPK